MPKNRYYHYDHESCSFVEVKPDPKKRYARLSILTVSTVVLAFLWSLGYDYATGTPEELALQEENEVLQEQLMLNQRSIQDFSARLEEFAEIDQDLYRTMLGAEAISEDVRQAGVGGTDPYEEFNRFNTSDLLRTSAQQLDQLERQIRLQNESYRELAELAKAREDWLIQMPAIKPVNGRVTSGFGMRHHPILKVYRLHPGVDIPTPTGTPVYATGDGIVKKAGRNSGGYGIHIIIEHSQAGYQTLYGHLSKIPSHIRPGRRVKRGEQIGLSGNTGLSAAPHVHYEVRTLEGKLLNPVHFFALSMTPQQYNTLLAEMEKSTISLD
ncbi:MAG: M23 family metallopeptidase [Rhodothermales bacterium]